MPSPTRIVLVIEPRPSERSGVCELVSSLGYLCVEACDGDEARSQLVQTRPDVILLSEALPGDGSVELLEAWGLDEDCGNIPVLMLSSASDRELLRRALDSGAADFVRTPPEPAELEARLGTALRLLALSEEMERISDRDRLTGLPNRRAFMASFRREIERVTRHGGELGFAVLDLDHFSSVNELHGRDVGDEVLASIARGLDSRVRAPDLVARWGGGSFAILLPETGLNDATRTLDRLRCELRERPSSHSVPGLCVTFSAGVAELDPLSGLSDIHHLLKAADAALARAKRAGRDKVILAREAI